jgi:hypothetical protein
MGFVYRKLIELSKQISMLSKTVCGGVVFAEKEFEIGFSSGQVGNWRRPTFHRTCKLSGELDSAVTSTGGPLGAEDKLLNLQSFAACWAKATYPLAW